MLVALDEHGDNIDSAGFARHLGRWRDEAAANTIFAIGGADGLSPDLRRKAKLLRCVRRRYLAAPNRSRDASGTIYRAATILAGHPYHRAWKLKGEYIDRGIH